MASNYLSCSSKFFRPVKMTLALVHTFLPVRSLTDLKLLMLLLLAWTCYVKRQSETT